MDLEFSARESDSPLVEGIYYTQSGSDAPSFVSMAAINWEIVFTTQNGKTTVSLRGPETRASSADTPENAEFLGIIFKLGSFMPHLPTSMLVDDAIHMEASRQSFRLHGASWEVPTFENADNFVARLMREGLLVREPIVDAALQGHLKELSLRSVQRRFLRATGLTHNTVYQIERAKWAAAQLAQGVPILDAVERAGYSDQPHLTRSLKRYLGETPAQWRNAGATPQLVSFLFKTTTPTGEYHEIID